MRDDRERLADVLAAIDRIRRYVQDDRTRFDTDELRSSQLRSVPNRALLLVRTISDLPAEYLRRSIMRQRASPYVQNARSG